jgi:hypothetical protein
MLRVGFVAAKEVEVSVEFNEEEEALVVPVRCPSLWIPKISDSDVALVFGESGGVIFVFVS